jgi:hypothetical protein
MTTQEERQEWITQLLRGQRWDGSTTCSSALKYWCIIDPQHTSETLWQLAVDGDIENLSRLLDKIASEDSVQLAERIFDHSSSTRLLESFVVAGQGQRVLEYCEKWAKYLKNNRPARLCEEAVEWIEHLRKDLSRSIEGNPVRTNAGAAAGLGEVRSTHGKWGPTYSVGLRDTTDVQVTIDWLSKSDSDKTRPRIAQVVIRSNEILPKEWLVTTTVIGPVHISATPNTKLTGATNVPADRMGWFDIPLANGEQLSHRDQFLRSPASRLSDDSIEQLVRDLDHAAYVIDAKISADAQDGNIRPGVRAAMRSLIKDVQSGRGELIQQSERLAHGAYWVPEAPKGKSPALVD